MISITRVFTALARSVHSPEFLVEALRDGRSPKNVYHDVYCSQCGHLTPFRSVGGAEGGVYHIADAPVSNFTSCRTIKDYTLTCTSLSAV